MEKPCASKKCRNCKYFQWVYTRGIFTFWIEKQGVCSLSGKLEIPQSLCGGYERRNEIQFTPDVFKNAEYDIQILLNIFDEM